MHGYLPGNRFCFLQKNRTCFLNKQLTFNDNLINRVIDIQAIDSMARLGFYD